LLVEPLFPQSRDSERATSCCCSSEAKTDPASVSERTTSVWIAEVERERRNLERELGRKPTPRRLTESEVKSLVAQPRDIVAVLAGADPLDKRTVYKELSVKLTYYPDGRVHVSAGAPSMYLGFVSEGRLQPQVHATRGKRGSNSLRLDCAEHP